MTNDKRQLKLLLAEEMKLYNLSKKNKAEKRFRHTKNYMLYKALKSLRIYEYRCALRDNTANSLLKHIRAFRVKLADRRRNIACEKVDIELTPGMIGKNLRLCHDNVVTFARIGENCIFHGNNMAGNKRTGASEAIPTIGNRVDIGYGAMIIGNVTIADDCIIGAGAVVTKSFTTPNSIIAGVPAKVIGYKGN